MGYQWNTPLKYFGSFFSNDNKSMDVHNPFCLHCLAVSHSSRLATCRRCSIWPQSVSATGLYPDNNVNGVTWNTAIKLPIFKRRYISNVQYMAFRQNDPFINDATNGLTFGILGLNRAILRPYPAWSLNGAVNAFLTNNVLYSHLTSELNNTARVRYYDRRDNTATLPSLTTLSPMVDYRQRRLSLVCRPPTPD